MIETAYNRLAGRRLERLAALSDGVFAVAMTLLVLNLAVPETGAVHGEADLLRALGALLPKLATYMMSFLTLGIFWHGQQVQLDHLKAGDRNFSWWNLAFLFAVTLVPFTTSLLAAFIAYRVAVVVYWFNILLLGGLLYASWCHALAADLVEDAMREAASVAIRRRIVLAQILYAIGMSLCAFSTDLALAAIVLVQLNYALAPKVKWLWRL